VTTHDAAEATTGASVARGGAWTLASRVIPQVNTLAISIAAARFLGPDDFGRQSFIAFVSISATLLASAGFSSALSRFTGERLGGDDPGAVRDLMRWGLAVQLTFGTVAGASLAAAGLLGADPGGAWVLAAVATAVGVIHSVPSSLLVGMQLWRQASIVGLVTGTVAVPAAIGVLAAGGGIVGMFAVEAAIGAANLLWTAVLARRALHGLPSRVSRAPDVRRRAARFASVSTVTVLLYLVVFMRSEFIFLEAFSTDAEIGLYSISFAAVSALSKLPDTVAIVIAPAFATLLGAGRWDRIRSGYSRMARLLPVVTFPLTALALVLGPELVNLVYGDEYSGVGPVLVVMLVILPIVSYAAVCEATLLALGRQRPIVVGLTVGTVVNIVLNLLLVPPYDAVGAAVANGIAQVTATVPMYVVAGRLAGPIAWDGRSLAVVTAASVAMGGAAYGAVAWLGGVPGVVAGGLAGSAAFLAVGAALGALTYEDAEWIETAAGARLGGVVVRTARLLAVRA
jgi:O-antigen/teichoic acid export membrane protein